jgi:hypothetical protein
MTSCLEPLHQEQCLALAAAPIKAKVHMDRLEQASSVAGGVNLN